MIAFTIEMILIRFIIFAIKDIFHKNKTECTYKVYTYNRESKEDIIKISDE